MIHDWGSLNPISTTGTKSALLQAASEIKKPLNKS
jgi:hypothetical protein